MSDFEEKYDYQEIMVEDISQIYQIANDYNSFYDLPRSGRGDPGDERTYLQAFYRGQSDSSWKITPSICRDTSVDESISEYGDLLFETSVYKGYKQDKIEMRGDRAEMSDFPLYLNMVAGGLDRRDQTIGGFSFVVKIYAVPVVEIIG